MKETQLWYCDICDKLINIKSKSKHSISKSHIHKKEYGIVVKEYDLIRLKNDEVKSILNDTIENCGNKYFHSFEFRCVYDIKLTNVDYNGKVILTITLENMKVKSQLYGLKKKFKTAFKDEFKFSEIVKSTRRIYSSLSNKNIQF